MQLQETGNASECESLWVFGYGSLCWRPGFEFKNAVTGHIKGFSRKFWQGNNIHRGTRAKPGRVATLVEDPEGTVYGIGFAITGDAIMIYLSRRECKLGGYDTKFTTFFPTEGEPIKNVLLYIATPENSQWLGDAPMHVMANEITGTQGLCGHNAEYILRLANFMRRHFPTICDTHLFNLENEIMTQIRVRNMSLVTLMGNGKECTIAFTKSVPVSNNNVPIRNENRVATYQFATAIPPKPLRCLNM